MRLFRGAGNDVAGLVFLYRRKRGGLFRDLLRTGD